MSVLRTRFAPSPTGYLHIGGVRTALFSWIFARHHGGRFLLRIEDTDLDRSSIESVNAILEGMAWLGLDYDEGPFYQTDRMARYREVIDGLLEQGLAYRCYCTREEIDAYRAEQMQRGDKPRYSGLHRVYQGPPREGVEPVVRFKNPLDGEVVLDDLVRGRIVISNHELDDLVIARPDGTPTYNFAVVVDDWDMGVSHVIRGDDHINNTPRQLNIFRALGAEPPQFAHLPMILGHDGRRLSKRHGAMGVMEYREQGFLPEAVLNYLVRLGWSHGDQEIFSLDEMVELFDIKQVNRAAATFNPDKLTWVNHHYIMHTDPAHVARHLGWHMGRAGIDPSAGPDLVEVVRALRERCKTLVEMADKARVYYEEFEHYDEKSARRHLGPDAAGVLHDLRAELSALEVWAADAIHGVVADIAERRELKMGKVAQPLRVALVGKAESPAIEVTAMLVGRQSTLARIERAIVYVAGLGDC